MIGTLDINELNEQISHLNAIIMIELHALSNYEECMLRASSIMVIYNMVVFE